MPIKNDTRRAGTLVTGLLVVAVLSAAPFGGGATGCTAATDPLAGTSWKLVGWTLSSLDPAEFTITAAFADRQVSGTSAVNSYSGPYAVEDGGGFTAGPFQGTLMAGPEPAMRAETAYLTLLAEAGSYTVSGDTLTLYDRNGNESLIFESAGR